MDHGMTQSTTFANVCTFAAAIAAPCLLSRQNLGREPPKRGQADDAAPERQDLYKGVQVRQVYPRDDGTEIETDVDIIAIHGLDTKSPDTWVWREQRGSHSAGVNWLTDSDMLPHRIQNARIFTCDWPAGLFEKKDVIQPTDKELARSLLHGIEIRHSDTDRPILFIASCLGGIVLSQALVIAASSGNTHASLWTATGGIVFLATPFRGTGFQQVAREAGFVLRSNAKLSNTKVTNRLDLVKQNNYLVELVGNFTSIWPPTDRDRIAIFYEMKKGNLLRKALPLWLADCLSRPKQLVDRGSAVLDIVPDALPLQRTHVMMNKFSGPEDPGYISVAGKIDLILRKIRHGCPIDRADKVIRKSYCSDRLRIDRLSGDDLPIDRCYINLAIVEWRSDARSSPQGKGIEESSSPFSLKARLKVDQPDSAKEVLLSSLFNPRVTQGRKTARPRRILVRGRAGVGKTALCKKIVHDFTYGNMWRDKFDRLLWIPLRNLKISSRTNVPGYNMRHLLEHEFRFEAEGLEVPDALLNEDHMKGTLFLLDGLDEVSNGLDANMKRFLTELLNQPNLIVTSRPHAMSLSGLNNLDLELETVGFYPAQVEEYVRATSNASTATAIMSFLQNHRLVQDLVRIPIQLDAFCFTWDDKYQPTTQTMSAFYEAIVGKLCLKDVSRREKIKEGEARGIRPKGGKKALDEELKCLEGLAFAGMYINKIDFEPTFREAVIEHFVDNNPIRFDMEVASLSFIRTTNPSSSARNQDYHFLHLTFQEFFAARYFVRQWKDKQASMRLLSAQYNIEFITPIAFLQKHKYNARYDIVWRFVAGLLDQGKEAACFFEEIEKEPIDLLGPAHQRLVMHCLHETVNLPYRIQKSRSQRLLQWSFFELDYNGRQYYPRLAAAPEFPEQALCDGLRSRRQDHFFTPTNRIVSETVAIILVDLLEDQDFYTRFLASLMLGGQPTLSEATVTALTKLLKHDDDHRRWNAADALRNRSKLPETSMVVLVEALSKFCMDDGEAEQFAAAYARGSLPKNTLSALAEFIRYHFDGGWEFGGELIFEGKSISTQMLAVRAIKSQSTLSDATVNKLVELFDHDVKDVRGWATSALGAQTTLSETNVAALIRLLHDKDIIAEEASWLLRSQSKLSETSVTALEKIFQDQVSGLRPGNARNVVIALEKQPNLSEATVAAIVDLLQGQDNNEDDQDEDDEDDEYEGDEDDVDYEDYHFPQDLTHVVKALTNQSRLPETILGRLVSLVESKDRSVRRVAAHILSLQSTLPGPTMAKLGKLLEDENFRRRHFAAYALSRQQTTSETTVGALVRLIKDDSKFLKFSACKALHGQSKLSEAAMAALEKLLKHSDVLVRLCAAYPLCKHSILPKEAAIALMSSLGDEVSDKSRAAGDLLESRPILLDYLLDALGMVSQSKTQTGSGMCTFPDLMNMCFFYKSLLMRSRKEHLALYVDQNVCVIEQASGLRKATLESPDQFQKAIETAREQFKTDEYLDLWHLLET